MIANVSLLLKNYCKQIRSRFLLLLHEDLFIDFLGVYLSMCVCVCVYARLRDNESIFISNKTNRIREIKCKGIILRICYIYYGCIRIFF